MNEKIIDFAAGHAFIPNMDVDLSQSVARSHAVFSRRGLHLDLRVQVMPMAALREVAADAAELGLNTLMIEWEASFPFERNAIISSEFAYSRDEVAEFLDYCETLGIEIVPLQQTFGHIEYILQHDRYSSLREEQRDLCQLCPSRAEEAIGVVGDILDEIIDAHKSPYVHIGGDETYLLGRCPLCQAKAAEEGRSKLYVDYLKLVAAHVIKRGRQPMIWADMLLRHPEAAHEMPSECVFVDWNYGWANDRFGDPENLRKTSFEFWGAPALRSAPDNHSLTCWERHFFNLRDYLPYARESKFSGIVLTSWSTSGHYGYEWDREGEAMALLPVRRVYPFQGFRILLAAFAEAIDATAKWDPVDFVARYARERFGLVDDAAQLWLALTSPVELLTRTTDLDLQLSRAEAAESIMESLTPVRNEEEFAHLRLMVDLRRFHVRFKQVEQCAQADDYTAARRESVADLLDDLVRESLLLERRFEDLNAENLYPEEIRREANYRFGKLRALHARLSRAGRLPLASCEV